VQIAPLRLLSYRYKKERSVAFKIPQNPFSAGALSRTPLGELTTPPYLLVGWREDTPHHTPPHSALAMRPLRIPARSTPMADMSGFTGREHWPTRNPDLTSWSFAVENML